MKKIVCLISILLLLLSVTACGETVPNATEAQTPTVPEGANAVATVEELQYAFSRLKTGDVIWLTEDLDMTDQNLAVVNVRSFTLEGNGHTIRNYHVKDQSGLFVDNGGDRAYTFRNLTLENCSVESDDEFAALFVGAARDTDAVTITNCHAVNCSVTGKKYASIFVSYTAGMNKGNGQKIPMTIEDCSAVGCTVTGGGSTGIAIGHSGGNDLTENIIKNLKIQDCTVTGPGEKYEGIVIGTAGTGTTEITGVTVTNVTTANNLNEGLRRYYGRNLTTLMIEGQEQELTQS